MKLQIGCLVIMLYVGYLYIKEINLLKKRTSRTIKHYLFDFMFIVGFLEIIFDGYTSYTVNHLETVSPKINLTAHILFFLLVQFFYFLNFLYFLFLTGRDPNPAKKYGVCYLPFCFGVLGTIFASPKIFYSLGRYTNYSTGLPAIITFSVIAVYFLLTLIFFFSRLRFVEARKKLSIIITLLTSAFILAVEIIFPETLFSALGVLLLVLTYYLILENPSEKNREIYHNEMISSFATLVENKDCSTGGHIKRTSLYVELIANKLNKQGKYKNYFTKDYLENLKKAAPMHDIGKICTPDSILQKSGKLTVEEYEIMKQHAIKGGLIVKNTFGHLDDVEYEQMTYEVAMYHHEKWNGKGYPRGLKETEIPLSARIMAVADVFDAVSARRCYRDALPLEECFNIIKNGKGTDFDSDVVDAFLSQKEDVIQIYNSIKEVDLQNYSAHTEESLSIVG